MWVLESRKRNSKERIIIKDMIGFNFLVREGIFL